MFLHLGLQSVVFLVVKESYINFFHSECTVSRVQLVVESLFNNQNANKLFSRASHVIYIMKALLI